MTGLLQRLVAQAHGKTSSLHPSAMPPIAAAPTAGQFLDPLQTGAEDSSLRRPINHSRFNDSAKPAQPGFAVADSPSFDSARSLSRLAEASGVAEASLDRPSAPPTHSQALGPRQPSFREPQPPGQQSLFAPTSLEDVRQSDLDTLDRETLKLAGTSSPLSRPTNLNDLWAQLQPLLPQQREISAMKTLSTPAQSSDWLGANDTVLEQAREVYVSIGRIEVRALPPATPAPQLRSERPESLSLEAYLERRRGGRR